MERSLSEARRGAVTCTELMHFRVPKIRTCLCSPPHPGDDTRGLPSCTEVSKLCWVLHICTWGKGAALGLGTRPHLLGCRGLSPRADSTEGARDCSSEHAFPCLALCTKPGSVRGSQENHVGRSSGLYLHGYKPSGISSKLVRGLIPRPLLASWCALWRTEGKAAGMHPESSAVFLLLGRAASLLCLVGTRLSVCSAASGVHEHAPEQRRHRHLQCNPLCAGEDSPQDQDRRYGVLGSASTAQRGGSLLVHAHGAARAKPGGHYELQGCVL